MANGWSHAHGKTGVQVVPSTWQPTATRDLEMPKWAPICWVVSPESYFWTMSSTSVTPKGAWNVGEYHRSWSRRRI